MSVRTQKLRKWSSFGHRFGHRSELPFTFGFLRCVHFVHDTSIVNFWHTTFECFWRLHFVPILTCWMNVFKFKNLANMCIKSHRFLCNPYRSWEFHDSIKYQCPGVTVPNGRRFWRALIYIYTYCHYTACILAYINLIYSLRPIVDWWFRFTIPKRGDLPLTFTKSPTISCPQNSSFDTSCPP